MSNPQTYALDRIENLTAAIAGCLTPATLESIIADIADNAGNCPPADLVKFSDQMSLQRETLVG